MRKMIKVSAATLALMLAGAGAASADETSEDSLRLVVEGGALSVVMNSAPELFTAMPTGADTVAEGSMALTVSDLRGTGEGWSLYQTLDMLNYDGPVEGVTHALDAANVSVSSMTNLVDHSEAAYNAPVGLLSGGDLGSGQTLLNAAPGEGMGIFDAEFVVSVDIPGKIYAGDYHGFLTTTVVSGEL